MYDYAGICSITARELLDSRGNPTVGCEVTLEDGSTGVASVPSGASTGKFEAHELRDGGSRYGGKGVLQAVKNIEGEILRRLRGENGLNQTSIDMALCELDGTESKIRLGANAILAVSIATAKAAAKSRRIPLYKYLGGVGARRLPMPMMNVINGGVHAGNSIDIQEFMIVPTGAHSMAEAIRHCAEVFHKLKTIVPATGVGDEGGYAPELDSDEDALKALCEGVKAAGFEVGRDFMFSIDAAASEWYSDGEYYLPKRKKKLSRREIIDLWRGYCDNYPIFSIEDGCGEDDWETWQELTEALGHDVTLVGDDLFVTNTARLRKGIRIGAANAVLVKMNQIGTITETLDCIETAKRSGYKAIISHRSGETCDTTIADLAVSANTGFIKTGAPSRGERTEKYNRLLRIDEQLGDEALFGCDCGKVN